MKFLHAHAEFVGGGAHLVQRNKTVVNIKGGIFQAFGHHRSGELLKFQSKCQALLASIGRGTVGGRLQQKNVANEIENRRRRALVAPLGAGHSLQQSCAIALTDLAALIYISPIYRETGDDLAHRIPQRVLGIVACPAVGAADFRQHVGEHIDLAGQRTFHDQPLAGINSLFQFAAAAGESAIEIG